MSEPSESLSAREKSTVGWAARDLAVPPLFNVVLVEPEIPNNTGNIGRTCVATHCALHLIRPLGFDTSEKACRRAGLDYWPRLNPAEHADFEEYRRACFGDSSLPGASAGASADGREVGSVDRALPPEHDRVWLFTTKRGIPFYSAAFNPGDHLIFGKETRGLSDDLLNRYPARLVTFPMAEGERSLNLATAVCAAVYEGLRQLIVRDQVRMTDTNRLVVGGSPASSASDSTAFPHAGA